MWKGGPLECGVPEFGGRTLSEGVWVGFRPSVLEGVSEGVSECRGRTLGGSVGAGLGSAQQEGGSKGRGLGPGAQQASQCLSGQGKHWPHSLPFLRIPPHIPQGLPHPGWTPKHGWVPLGVGTPPLPQPPLTDAGPRHLDFIFALLPSLPLPQDLRS